MIRMDPCEGAPVMELVGSRVWINGSICDAQSAHVGVTDRGFTLGDGLFETMLWTGTQLRFFDDHIARLAKSADELGLVLPYTADQIKAALENLAKDTMGAAGALRLTVTRGSGQRGLAFEPHMCGLMMATLAPFETPTTSVKLAIVATTRHAGAPSARFKTLSYIDNIMALHQARLLGADDAIMLGTTGNIACVSGANILLRCKGAVLTPALEDGALPGIVRGRLIQAGLVEEARIAPSLLAHCDGGVLTNALIGARAISSIGDKVFSSAPKWRLKLIDALAAL
jgi:branched-chain amino acid aminotransferase